MLSSTDGDAFLYYVSETVESISGSGTLTLHNDYMPVVPVITTTAELRYGGNSVSVTSEGTTTFIYRQGRL